MTPKKWLNPKPAGLVRVCTKADTQYPRLRSKAVCRCGEQGHHSPTPNWPNRVLCPSCGRVLRA